MTDKATAVERAATCVTLAAAELRLGGLDESADALDRQAADMRESARVYRLIAGQQEAIK